MHTQRQVFITVRRYAVTDAKPTSQPPLRIGPKSVVRITVAVLSS